jgi:hypothetical protein
MKEINLQGLKIQVSPSNGSQTRRVLALWQGEFCYADMMNVWRSSDRERFYETLTKKIGKNPKEIISDIDRQLITIAEDADSEAAKIAKASMSDLQGRPVEIESPEPWPEQVNLADVLEQHVNLLKKHIFVPEEALVAAALWTCATHAIDMLDSIGYLRITSPDRSCGKSTFARLLKESLRRPLYLANVTPASLFRLIEMVTPSLIMDECDNLLQTNAELLSMLNAGISRKEAVVYRCVGDSDEIREFTVFGPKLICGIGDVAGPLASRCITILMHRKPKNLKLERINRDSIKEAEEIGRKYCKWIEDNKGSVNWEGEPSAPSVLDDRQVDCWRTLFLLADAAGEKWSEMARKASLKLSDVSDVEDNVNVRLLLDIANEFEGFEKVTADDIRIRLNNCPHLDWGSYGRNGLSSVVIGRKLKQLGIKAYRTKRERIYWMDDIRKLAANYVKEDCGEGEKNDE